LLRVGAIGFLLGFLAWLFWLLLAASALLSFYLGYGYRTYMSGILGGPYAITSLVTSWLMIHLRTA
jgi:hypothetical protein